jgi:hypothetical protein
MLACNACRPGENDRAQPCCPPADGHPVQIRRMARNPGPNRVRPVQGHGRADQFVNLDQPRLSAIDRTKDPGRLEPSRPLLNSASLKPARRLIKHPQHIINLIRDSNHELDFSSRPATLHSQPCLQTSRAGSDAAASSTSHSVGELAGHPGGHLGGQPRLAHPVRAGHGDEPVFAEQCGHLVQLAGAADEAGQGARETVQDCQRRSSRARLTPIR